MNVGMIIGQALEELMTERAADKLTQEKIDSDVATRVASRLNMGDFKFVIGEQTCGDPECKANHMRLLLQHPQLDTVYGRRPSARKWNRTLANFAYMAPVANAVLEVMPVATRFSICRGRGFACIEFFDEGSGLLVRTHLHTPITSAPVREAIKKGVLEGENMAERFEIAEGDWVFGLSALPASTARTTDGTTAISSLTTSYVVHKRARPTMSAADYETAVRDSITESYAHSHKTLTEINQGARWAEAFVRHLKRSPLV